VKSNRRKNDEMAGNRVRGPHFSIEELAREDYFQEAGDGDHQEKQITLSLWEGVG